MVYRIEAPAEIFIEPLRFGAGYVWSICQPDAHYGEWCSGKADTKEQAFEKACIELYWIHKKQGYIDENYV